MNTTTRPNVTERAVEAEKMRLYRVIYPLITRKSSADFETMAEAQAFATAKRNAIAESPLIASEMWRQVDIVEIADRKGNQ